MLSGAPSSYSLSASRRAVRRIAGPGFLADIGGYNYMAPLFKNED
jgi:hypothetical protein